MPATAKEWLPNYWVPDLEPLTKLVPPGNMYGPTTTRANYDTSVVLGFSFFDGERGTAFQIRYDSQQTGASKALELSVTRQTAQGLSEAITERGTWTWKSSCLTPRWDACRMSDRTVENVDLRCCCFRMSDHLL